MNIRIELSMRDLGIQWCVRDKATRVLYSDDTTRRGLAPSKSQRIIKSVESDSQ